MKFYKTELEGVWLAEPVIYRDHRGEFLESFREEYFRQQGVIFNFVQDNISTSVKGTVRGLHYQKEPHAQAKLVMAIQGEILDVAVDIRKKSKTFGHYFSSVLNSSNRKMLLVPPGFAHGFSVLSDKATVYYKCSSYYHKDSERGILWNDPAIGVDWKVESPVLSEKDKQHPELHEVPSGDLF